MTEAAQTTTTTETSENGGDGEETKTEITSMITAQSDGDDKGGEKKTESADGGEKKVEAKADEKKADEKPYVIAVPKEYEQHVDKAGLEKFTALAKEAGLTLEQAQKIAAFDFERRAGEVKSQDELVVNQSKVWLDEIKKDPELGGEKLAVTQANVNYAFTTFGGAQLSRDLVALGMENYPGLVRFANAVGARLREDSGSIKGGKSGSAPPRRESIYDPS